MERVVIKAGGSLLEFKESTSKFQELIARGFQQKQVNLLFGGGPLVDAMRKIDSIHHFDAETMHWWCVDLLHQSFEMAMKLFPEAIGIDQVDAFQQHRDEGRSGLFLFSTRAFYSQIDKDALPCDWTTTSDSIAAFLAHELYIDRLILIKSCRVPSDCDALQAANLGIVDKAFPQASAGLNVQFRGIESLFEDR